MNNDIVFKGMTRSALFLGVPYIPLIVGGMAILLLGLWFNLAFWLLLIPFYAALYSLTKYDENIFSVYANAIKTHTIGTNKKYHKVKTYSTHTKYRKLDEHRTKLNIYPLDKHPNLQKYLPYSTHITKDIVVTKEHEYISTWVVDGVHFDMVDSEYLSNEKEALNTLIRSLSNENIAIYIHSAMLPYSDKLDYTYDNPYLKDFADAYYDNIEKSNLHITLRYITLVYTPLKNRVEKSNFMRLDLEKKEKAVKKFIFQMEEISKKMTAGLNRYGATRLGIYKEDSVKYSTLLEFFNFLVGGKFSKIRVLKSTIDSYITGNAKNLKFNKGLLKIEYNNNTNRYVQALEIKEFCSETYIGILNDLLKSQITYVVTQSFVPMIKRDAKKSLKAQRGRLAGSHDDGVSQIEDLTLALDRLTSDEISFGEYHFSIFIYADTVEKVKEDTEYVSNKIEEIGHIMSHSDIAFPATYFAQFPSNTQFRPNVSLISSRNFADFISFHSYPLGRRDNNNWGQAISILNTPSNQPYYLNIHQVDKANDFNKFTLGNSLVIGQSGTGKTAFLNFLLNMTMKYNQKETFPKKMLEKHKNFFGIYLDMKYGAMTNILAAGGEYIILKNGEDTGFNPFMCEYTKRNVRKLEILIKIMIGDQIKLSPADNQKITDAINFIMTEFEEEDREYPISLLLENIDEDPNKEYSIKEALKLWKNGEKYGWVFDNKADRFLNGSNNLTGIDGTEFLNDDDVKDAMSHYILWRVMDIMDGRRFGLWIDEAWKWIENDHISNEVKEKLKTNRSRNNFIILGVQSVEDFLQNKNARAIIEQSASIFLFANPKAVKDDYVKGLTCSESEYLRVKGFDKTNYNFLVKRDEESIVTSLDLSNMDSFFIKALSTDETDVESIQKIFKQDITLEEKIEQLKQYFKEN